MNYKVLNIIDHMRFGGAQRIVRDLTSYYDSVTMYSLKGLRQDGKELLDPVKYRGGNIKSGFEIPFILKDIIQLIEYEDVDLVHCHLRGSFIVGLLLAIYFKLRRKAKPKFVFHEHGWIIYAAPPYKALLKIIAKYGKIISCSDYIMDQIVSTGIEEKKIVSIRNYVKTDAFFKSPGQRTAFRQKWGVSEEDFLVGFAGRLVPEKGCHILLRAFAETHFDHRMKLIIAGAGSDENKLQKYIQKYDLSSRVIMLGYVEEMNQFYNGIDVFVFPSIEEPFGMVQLEAQGAGTPVIASDIRSIHESLDSTNSILLPANSPEELARCLDDLAQDRKSLDPLSRNGIINASRFSFDFFIRKLELTYKEVLG